MWKVGVELPSQLANGDDWQHQTRLRTVALLRPRMHATSVVGPNGNYDRTSCSRLVALCTRESLQPTRVSLASSHGMVPVYSVLPSLFRHGLVFPLYLSAPQYHSLGCW